MIIIQPTLDLIPKMQELLKPEIEKGVILERSSEVMANMIRSYHVAFEEEEKLKENSLFLEQKSLEDFKNPIMLGFCALHIHSSTLAEIRSLIVNPLYQRKGVARNLIQDCISEANILKIKEVLVLTYKRELFSKLGFVEISKEKIPNQKIWADCILCKHFPVCDEIALIKKI
ncbi:GNAT family N-acetyltransferase [Helicobacter valdiviensis]|uniref:GNAT family N-acetyltransferase n=1 Tax=Helicobacter valdiviensis TaxID=1458358 RepID=A0A2W6MY04_9HELI|nr:N-acetyltransferase [Helicobacter valdiviensis]PZT48939.1 GNAT family N-acetyltransferase [Helicobacter valdiviensis]